MEDVQWGPPLAVLAMGLVLAAVLVARLRRVRPAAAPAAAEVERRELEARREELIDQLRELEETGSGRDPDALAAQRQQLELEAARVLARLDQLGGPREPAPPVAPPATAQPGQAAAAHQAARRGFLWGVGSAAAVAGLVFWVAGSAQPRASEPMTGTVGAPGASAPEGAPRESEEAQLKARLASNPDDIDTRMELTQLYLGRRELMQVWEHTQYVLSRWPGHPRAMSYQALVRLAMGEPETAEAMLKQAMAAAPELLEPRLHLALVYARTGRAQAADSLLAEAAQRFPQEAEGLGRLRQDLKAQLGGGAPAAAPGAAPAGAAPAEGQSVAGVIELAQGRSADAGGIVFLTARAAGESQGPPVAAKRLPARFPLQFTLGAADSMMGGELPSVLRLEARLDSDGDPLTRSPQDPSARLDGVRLGQAGLRLSLR